jgi:hypothetical protein
MVRARNIFACSITVVTTILLLTTQLVLELAVELDYATLLQQLPVL